eukprot:2911162-Amphidinium_carterae.1
MCETTTGLGYATIVQKKGTIYNAIQTIKRFIVEKAIKQHGIDHRATHSSTQRGKTDTSSTMSTSSTPFTSITRYS